MASYRDNPIAGLGGKLIRGAVWNVGMRWSMRFMGLISVAIVARLLTPEDFGVFAVITAVVALLDALTDIGPDLALIRHPDPKKSHYDTAWTLTFIIHAAAAAILVAVAPFVSAYFDDPRYEPIAYAMAAIMMMAGLKNIGTADFRRNLEFHKDFRLEVGVQLSAVVVTILAAWILRSYWALVVGTFGRALAHIVFGYLMHPYRPRMSLKERSDLLNFSFWTSLRSVAIFTTGKADLFIVGKFFSPTVTGWYAVSADLARMATFEILQPIGRALLPGLSRMQHDKDWNRRNLKKVFNATATISAAAGAGVAALSEPAITLVYGANFTGAAGLLELFAIAAAISGFGQPVSQYLIVLNRVKELALLFLAQGVILLLTLGYLAHNGADAETLATARILVVLLMSLRLFYLLTILKELAWHDVLIAWIRPVIAGALMYFVLIELVALSPWSNVLLLLVYVPAGALIFSVTLFGCWKAMGQPPGVEEELVERIGGKFGNRS